MEPSTSNELSTLLAVSQEICWIDKLPMEILEKIFNLLTDIEQVRCETVCKKWFNIFQSFWQEYDGFRFKSSFYPDVAILRGDKIAKTFSVQKRPALNNDDIFKWCVRQGGSSFTNVEIENVLFRNSGPFSFMLKNCSKLKSLTIDSVSFDCFFENPTSETLLTTVLSKENLTHLFISNCLNKDFQIEKSVGQSNITHLKLDNFPIPSNEFPILCQFIASNLKCFCLKRSTLDLESLVNGVRYLNNVENLNMEFRSRGFDLGLVLVDDTLRGLAGCLSNLKILSLSHQTQITSAGISYILQSSFGRNTLTNLNVEYCSHIDDQIYEGLKDRLADSPMLNIAAFGSNISSELVNRSNESCRWVVVIDKITEGNIYFGDEKKESGNDDEESGGLGYDSDGEHIDHDVDFDDFYDHDDYDDDSDYEVDDDDDIY